MAEKDNSSGMLIIGIVLVMLVTAGFTYYIVKAAEQPSAIPNPGTNATTNMPTISVNGEAAKTVAPDILTIGFTVETTGASSSASQGGNSAAMEKIKSALLALGVKDSDIQTTYFSTQPQYNESCYDCPYPIPYYVDSYPTEGVSQAGQAVDKIVPPANPSDIVSVNEAVSGSASSPGSAPSGSGIAEPSIAPSPPVIYPYPCKTEQNCIIIGYTTTHTIQVMSSNTTSAGKLVAAATGVYNSTKVEYVYFSLSDQSRISNESELEALAAANAKAKAQGIASGVGTRLGPIISISTDYHPIYPVYAYTNPETMNSAMLPYEPPPTDIYPTQTQMSASITVVYALLPDDYHPITPY